MRSRRLLVLIMTAVLVIACFGTSDAKAKKVRIATLPYLDYTGLVAAKALGLDQEMGLDFEFVAFPLEPQALQAMVRGSIDITQGAIGSFIPLMPQAPELRIIVSACQFKGFLFVGREGKITPFDEYLKKYGGDFAKAQEATLKQFKGKTIMLVKSSFEPTVVAGLSQVGLTLDDITMMDFQNDAQAAVAFLRGIGDLYIGSLPQLTRLMKEPGYVMAAGNEVLGPAGLWYSNIATTEKYLKENPDTVRRIAAVYYRAMQYLKDQPEKALSAMVDYLNRQAATNMTVEDARDLVDGGFEAFSTVDESIRDVYSPKSPLYWRLAADYYVKQNELMNKIKAGAVNIDKIIVQESIFNELVSDAELMKWVKSPTKP